MGPGLRRDDKTGRQDGSHPLVRVWLLVPSPDTLCCRSPVAPSLSKQGFVYILASRRNGTVYLGVTSTLILRVWQHKEGLVDGFTRKYNVKTLDRYQQCDDIAGAILREKQMKEWKRDWKIELIERVNPSWRDLYSDFTS